MSLDPTKNPAVAISTSTLGDGSFAWNMMDVKTQGAPVDAGEFIIWQLGKKSGSKFLYKTTINESGQVVLPTEFRPIEGSLLTITVNGNYRSGISALP